LTTPVLFKKIQRAKNEIIEQAIFDDALEKLQELILIIVEGTVYFIGFDQQETPSIVRVSSKIVQLFQHYLLELLSEYQKNGSIIDDSYIEQIKRIIMYK
jgi:hypothetical protein